VIWEYCTVDKTAKIGKGTVIGSHCFIGKNVKIGKNCKIQTGCFIPENVIIKDNVFIAPHVVFCNDKYPPSKGKWKNDNPTIVEDSAVIGANCTILPSISICKNARIGAGIVLTKSVTNNSWIKKST